MNALDVLALLLCAGFTAQWLSVSRQFARTGRSPEANLMRLCALNAASIVVASIFIHLPYASVEGTAVRIPGLVSMMLCIALAAYLQAKTRGELPVLLKDPDDGD